MMKQIQFYPIKWENKENVFEVYGIGENDERYKFTIDKPQLYFHENSYLINNDEIIQFGIQEDIPLTGEWLSVHAINIFKHVYGSLQCYYCISLKIGEKLPVPKIKIFEINTIKHKNHIKQVKIYDIFNKNKCLFELNNYTESALKYTLLELVEFFEVEQPDIIIGSDISTFNFPETLFVKSDVGNYTATNLHEIPQILLIDTKDIKFNVKWENTDVWDIVSYFMKISKSYISSEWYKTKPFNVLLYKELYDKNQVIDFTQCENLQKPKGLGVYSPKKGIYDNVVCITVKSFYPSIMIAYNIDYTTYENGNCGSLGYIPTIMKRLISQRNHLFNEVKSRKEVESHTTNFQMMLLKYAINQIYGLICSNNSETEFQGAYLIPLIAKEINSKIISLSEDLGLNVIHQRVDQTFIQFQNSHTIDLLLNKLHGTLPKQFKFDVDYITKFVNLGKFSYVCNYKHLSDLTYKGVIKRSDLNYIKDTFKNIMNMVFLNKDKEVILQEYEKCKKLIADNKVSLESLTIKRTYKSSSNERFPWMKVVKKIRERGGIVNEGDYINYIRVNHDNVFKCEEVDYCIQNGLCVDISYYINLLDKKMESLLELL